MRKILSVAAALVLLAFGASAQFNIKDALNAVGNAASGSSTSSSSTSNAISGLIGAVSSVVGSSDMTVETLTGKWTYSKPAVTFQSDNLLKKAGGAAMAQTIVTKITPYYNRFGVKGTTMEFTSDGNFTIAHGALKVTGTYTLGEKGACVLNIKALGKIPAGKLNVFISGSSSKMQITCSADKLLAFVTKVGSVTGNSTIKALSSALSSYEGLNIGMEMTK